MTSIDTVVGTSMKLTCAREELAEKLQIVGRGKLELPFPRSQKDAAENLDRSSRRDATRDDAELLNQLVS